MHILLPLIVDDIGSKNYMCIVMRCNTLIGANMRGAWLKELSKVNNISDKHNIIYNIEI